MLVPRRRASSRRRRARISTAKLYIRINICATTVATRCTGLEEHQHRSTSTSTTPPFRHSAYHKISAGVRARVLFVPYVCTCVNVCVCVCCVFKLRVRVCCGDAVMAFGVFGAQTEQFSDRFCCLVVACVHARTTYQRRVPSHLRRAERSRFI